MKTPRWLPLLPPTFAAALLLLACGGGGGALPGATTPPPDPNPGAPYGLVTRETVPALAFPIDAATPGAMGRARAFPNLTFTRPVFLTHAPDGTDRVFVVEQGGRIFVFPNQDGVTSASTFLDISARVSRAGNEEGLLGLAFSPDYAVPGAPTAGAFYVHYSAANPRRSVISRFQVTANPDDANESSESILLTIPDPYDNHNGGWMDFGPDGMLYLALGDGGSAGDPQNNGQTLTAILGKILRIDPRGGTPYAIPSDNPFVGRTGGERGEIWAYGVRNGWRASFDRNTGDLWLGDVGQGAREEVSVVPKGGNLGWRLFEGTATFNNPTGVTPSDYVPPVRDYPRADGSTVVGGYVYRGTALPSLRGAYLYGDYGSGNVWGLVRSGGAVVSNTLLSNVSSLSSFGEDRDGEVYAVSLSGSIWRFTEPGGSDDPVFPALLSETGLFSNVATLTPVAGLVPYDVNAPLWSDGATKRRWIALPGAERITFSATEAWAFPLGTVLVKHFELRLSAIETRRVETRVLVRERNGWSGYTYRWNDAQSDAELLPGAATDVFTVSDASGTRPQTWTYPSRTDCLRCHTEAAGRVLGVRTMQLNRDFDYGAVTDNQLRSWNHVALFTTDVGAASSYGALPDPADAAVAVASRARAYLEANCAQCHRPSGPTPVDLDLRWGIPASAMRALDVRPTAGTLGLADAWRIRSGSKESSVLWERMRRTDPTHMPPLASHVVDDLAVDLVGQWIDGL